MSPSTAAGLRRAIPALPVRDVDAAVAHYVTTTDFGTREFATVDLDGNLLSLFRREAD